MNDLEKNKQLLENEKRIELLEERLNLVSTYVEISLELLANVTDMNTMNKLYELNKNYNDVWESMDKEK